MILDSYCFFMLRC